MQIHPYTFHIFPPTCRAHPKASKGYTRFAAMHPYIVRTGSFIQGDHLHHPCTPSYSHEVRKEKPILPSGLITIRYRKQSSLEALSQISFLSPLSSIGTPFHTGTQAATSYHRPLITFCQQQNPRASQLFSSVVCPPTTHALITMMPVTWQYRFAKFPSGRTAV